jgi:transcriptional regulator with XRE-family HTH domain
MFLRLMAGAIESRTQPVEYEALDRAFGQRVRDLRLALGLNQQELADRMEPPTSQHWISALETGKRRTQIWDVARIAKALGVAQSVLLPGTDEDVRLSELGIVLADIEPLLSDEDKREIIEHARLRARLAEGRARAAQLERGTDDGGGGPGAKRGGAGGRRGARG